MGVARRGIIVGMSRFASKACYAYASPAHAAVVSWPVTSLVKSYLWWLIVACQRHLGFQAVQIRPAVAPQSP